MKTQSPSRQAVPQQAAFQPAEMKRRADIRAEFASYSHLQGMDAVQASCENDPAMTPEGVGKVILSHMANQAFPVGATHVDTVNGNYGGVYGDTSRDFMAAASDAILTRAGLPVPNPHPQAADFSRSRLVDIAQQMLSMRGVATAGLSSARIIEAAMTRSDLPQLLEGVGSRALRQAYETAPASHALWTAEREVSDFRTQTLLQLSEAPGLEKVQEGGEYTNGYFSEAASTFKIETFGKIIGITRQAMINDDLGAFTRLPAAFGATARRMEADLVYSKLLSDELLGDGLPLFHEDHGNLGAPAGLSTSGLSHARSAMRRQRTLDGLGVLDLQPKYLIVPTVLETFAEELLASLARPDAAHSGVANATWIRGLTLVTDPRLDEVSETAWYLASDPASFDTIIRAYLSGTARPELVEDEEFRRDVMSFKARLDFGVGVIDYRGLYKNPGA